MKLDRFKPQSALRDVEQRPRTRGTVQQPERPKPCYRKGRGQNGEKCDLPHSARNVNQGIGAVQDGQEAATPVASFCASEEPLLDVPLCPPLCACHLAPPEHVGFRLEHGQGVFLGHIPHLCAATIVDSRHEGGKPVEEELQHPVEHFDQEWEFLQKARVGMARETRRVGSSHGPYPKDTTSLAFQVDGPASGRVAVEGRSWRKRVGGTCYRGVGWTLATAKQRVVFRSGEVH